MASLVGDSNDPSVAAIFGTHSHGGRTGRTKHFARLMLLTVLMLGLGLFPPNAAAHPAEPFRIVNHYTGIVVDVPAPQGSTANTFTVLWPYWGGANQQFDLVKVDPNNRNSDVLLKVRHGGGNASMSTMQAGPTAHGSKHLIATEAPASDGSLSLSMTRMSRAYL